MNLLSHSLRCWMQCKENHLYSLKKRGAAYDKLLFLHALFLFILDSLHVHSNKHLLQSSPAVKDTPAMQPAARACR